MNEENKKKEENEEAIKKAKEKRRRKRALKKYSKMINYPNMKIETRQVTKTGADTDTDTGVDTDTDTDDELFNNLFDENQVICQNNVKRYVYCSTIFIVYAAIGFMYYTYIY
jgi:hypothetical protein